MNRLFLLITLLFTSYTVAAQIKFNGGFEIVAGDKATGWKLDYAIKQNEVYKTALDSTEKKIGKYAMLIEKLNDKQGYAAFGWPIEKSFEGKTVEITGYIKTKDVTAGSAGLWMRVEGHLGNLMAEFMEKDGAKGTTDWKKYSIEYKFNKDEVKSISVGGILMGNGKAWFDDLELTIDGKPIDQAKEFIYSGRQVDSTFNKSSKIALSEASQQQQINLTFAGQFWGFLKYHHPAVAKGGYHWDAELFRLLPSVIAAKNNQELSKALETYLDQLPKPEICKSCDEKITKEIAQTPNYGDLFNGNVASTPLTEKLTYIKNNRNLENNYYVEMAPGVGNPKFKNERAYADMLYPDAGYRLLALYRYWAMINYFFPYKHQTDHN